MPSDDLQSTVKRIYDEISQDNQSVLGIRAALSPTPIYVSLRQDRLKKVALGYHANCCTSTIRQSSKV